VQVFTPRNAREISVAKAFPDPPQGIRATFRDKIRNIATGRSFGRQRREVETFWRLIIPTT
jgi:hypothetical protein